MEKIKIEGDVLNGALILLGTIIGAGIFSLPYFSEKVGVYFLLILIYAIFVNYFLSFLYLKMFLKTNASRFEEIPLRLGSKKLFYFTHALKYLTILSAALIYLTGIPDIIRDILINFFKIHIDLNILRLILIVLLFFMVLPSVKVYSKIESRLVEVLIGFILILTLLLLFSSKPSNLSSIVFSFKKFSLIGFLFVLGPFLFACMDTTTTPEVYKYLNYNFKKMKKSLAITYLTIFIIYTLFIIAFLGNFGKNILDNAVKNLISLNPIVLTKEPLPLKVAIG